MTKMAPPPRVGWIRRLLAAAGAHRKLAVLVVLTAVFGTGLAAVPPLVMRVGLDDAVAGRTDKIAAIALGLGGVAVVVFLGSFARQFLAAKLALAVQHDLRQQVFGSLQRLDGAKQDELRTGQVMSRANVDLQMVQGLLSQLPMAAGSIVLVLVSFVAMVWLSPLLTTVHVAMVAGCVLVTLWSTKRLSPATWAVQHRNAVLAQIVTETVAGAYVVKGFGQERREVQRFADQATKLYGERMRVSRMQSQPMATLQSLPMLAQIAVLVLGGYLAIRGQLSVGDLVAFAAFATTLIGPAGVLSNLVVAAQLTAPAAERVYELIDTHPDVTDAPDARDVPTGPLGVSFEDVTFSYTADEPVLRGLTLRVEPGETMAVVGPSGSGKSTLALLLPRFYDPQRGRIRLTSGDDGGHELTALRQASLRQRVGVVFEEPFLFAGPVAANIAYGHPDATRDEIERVARTAGAEEFVARLPSGYDTELPERGSSLSGGQRQRIALARALLADPTVLVLDDATSAVDAATAADIDQALAEVAATHTTLVIAHRKATLAMADRVALLEAGRVVDVGTPAELEERSALFGELFTEKDATGGERSEEARYVPGQATPELWPAEAAATDGDEVLVDDMPVDRAQARTVAELPAATDRPAARLGDELAPDSRPPHNLLDILRPVRGLVVVAVLLMLSDAVATSAIPALIQQGLDAGVLRRDQSGVLVAAGIAVLVVAVNWVALFWQPRFLTRTGEGAMFAMRVRSFRHLHSLGLEHFEQQRAGGLLTRMTTDITSLADFVESGLTIAVVNLLTLTVMATAMIVLDPGLALVAFGLLPVLAVATAVFRKLSGSAYEETRDKTGEVNADLQENLEGLRTSQTYGQSDSAERRFGTLSDALRAIRLRAQSYAAAYFPFVFLLAEVATMLVLIVGMTRIAAGTLSAGVLTAFLLYLGLFFAPFQQLSIVFDGYQRARVGAGRIAELLRTRAAMPDTPDAVPIRGRLSADVEFDSVAFSYGDGQSPALDDVNLSVPAGCRVALVGATGSGKSTLVKLVARFYDVSTGVVRVAGVDVRQYRLADLRAHLGVVPQEPHLFSGSVADNIRYARPDASDADVEAAAAAVGARDNIARLSRGFRQPVGEGGRRLSTGQGQLIALARAELADRDLLVLDEPTASLDPKAERAVLAAMDRLSERRTTFVVTHRLRSAERADLVVVLDAGRIVEQGPPGRLRSAGGAYARLLRIDSADGDGHLDGRDRSNGQRPDQSSEPPQLTGSRSTP